MDPSPSLSGGPADLPRGPSGAAKGTEAGPGAPSRAQGLGGGPSREEATTLALSLFRPWAEALSRGEGAAPSAVSADASDLRALLRRVFAPGQESRRRAFESWLREAAHEHPDLAETWLRHLGSVAGEAGLHEKLTALLDPSRFSASKAPGSASAPDSTPSGTPGEGEAAAWKALAPLLLDLLREAKAPGKDEDDLRPEGRPGAGGETGSAGEAGRGSEKGFGEKGLGRILERISIPVTEGSGKENLYRYTLDKGGERLEGFSRDARPEGAFLSYDFRYHRGYPLLFLPDTRSGLEEGLERRLSAFGLEPGFPAVLALSLLDEMEEGEWQGPPEAVADLGRFLRAFADLAGPGLPAAETRRELLEFFALLPRPEGPESPGGPVGPLRPGAPGGPGGPGVGREAGLPPAAAARLFRDFFQDQKGLESLLMRLRPSSAEPVPAVTDNTGKAPGFLPRYPLLQGPLLLSPGLSLRWNPAAGGAQGASGEEGREALFHRLESRLRGDFTLRRVEAALEEMMAPAAPRAEAGSETGPEPERNSPARAMEIKILWAGIRGLSEGGAAGEMRGTFLAFGERGWSRIEARWEGSSLATLKSGAGSEAGPGTEGIAKPEEGRALGGRVEGENGLVKGEKEGQGGGPGARMEKEGLGTAPAAHAEKEGLDLNRDGGEGRGETRNGHSGGGKEDRSPENPGERKKREGAEDGKEGGARLPFSPPRHLQLATTAPTLGRVEVALHALPPPGGKTAAETPAGEIPYRLVFRNEKRDIRRHLERIFPAFAESLADLQLPLQRFDYGLLRGSGRREGEERKGEKEGRPGPAGGREEGRKDPPFPDPGRLDLRA